MTIRVRLWLAAMACAALVLAAVAAVHALLGAAMAPLGAAGPLARLVATATIVLVLFAPIAWVLARLAYHPVRDVTRTGRGILSTGQLDRRCFYAGPRDDVGDLVVVVNELLVRYDAALGALGRLRAAPPRCDCPRPALQPDHADLVLDAPAGASLDADSGPAPKRTTPVRIASDAADPAGAGAGNLRRGIESGPRPWLPTGDGHGR